VLWKAKPGKYSKA